jgi:hypothetical protein
LLVPRHQPGQRTLTAPWIPSEAEMLPRVHDQGVELIVQRGVAGKGIVEQLLQVFVRSRVRISRCDQPVACQYAASEGISFAR